MLSHAKVCHPQYFIRHGMGPVRCATFPRYCNKVSTFFSVCSFGRLNYDSNRILFEQSHPLNAISAIKLDIAAYRRVHVSRTRAAVHSLQIILMKLRPISIYEPLLLRAFLRFHTIFIRAHPCRGIVFRSYSASQLRICIDRYQSERDHCVCCGARLRRLPHNFANR